MYISTRKFIYQSQVFYTSTGSYKGFANGQDVSNYLVVDGSNKTSRCSAFYAYKTNCFTNSKSTQNNNTKQGNETGTAATGAGNAPTTSTSSPPNSNNTNSSSIMSFTLMPSKNGSKSQGNAMNMTGMTMTMNPATPSK